jgi:phosphatidylglycerophosphate synthase
LKVSYWRRVREIYAAQNFKEFYSRTFSGKISPFIAAACCGTPITPNHLTVLMIPTGILGGIAMSMGTPLGFLIGGLLFVLLNIIDAADGELARYTKRTSDFGDYLDRVAHYMTNTALFVGLGVGLFNQTGHLYLLPLMFFANSAIIGDDIIRDLLTTCGLERSVEGSADRKALKAGTSVSPGSLGKIISGITSHVATWHIIPALGALQLLWPEPLILELYYGLVSLAIIAKFLVRARKIRRLYA